MLIREATDRVTHMTHSNLFRHALIIVVVLTSGYLACTNTGSALFRLGMRWRSQKRVATGMYTISHGDGARMATIVRVVSTFLNQTLCDDGHFD